MSPWERRFRDGEGWNGFKAKGRERLRETSPLVTLAIHVVLILASGAVGGAIVFAVGWRVLGWRLNRGPDPSEDLQVLAFIGFAVGALFALLTIVRTRLQFREYEKRHGHREGTRNPRGDSLEENLQRSVRDEERRKSRLP